MQLNAIEEIIEDIRQGKMVILMDDEDRENEGDLIIAAEKVTPEAVNFMASKARGLICLTLTGERCDYLGLPSMVQGKNGGQYGTPFTVSIEAAHGVTTGISAADRAKTIQVAVAPDSKPDDIVQPGHIFPLRAQPGGVLSRAGHTEAGCDLARLAGLTPAAAIVEIMNEDGTMARRPDLETFAETHGLKIGTIADLIHYRILNERTVTKVDQQTLATEFGEFELTAFKDSIQGNTHIALALGEINADEPTLVRVHVTDPIRDLLAAQPPQHTSWSIQKALKKVADEGKGVVVLLNPTASLDFEGSMNRFFHPEHSQRTPGQSGSGAYLMVGTGSQILRELGVGKMKLLSSPMKFGAISGFELEICEYIPFEEA
ncbi:bifunctional 3,4-dihydroxy-2-butanone-4-phosphate synthase/GTP cyclohydrolase II [Spartinivicinus poritis]|uniref:3,4-dihydroxy-2-butanone 4-phosphate synthase n=1 Tax=Spartinivicinus poritis TaxID=2994640 RepID=A0ABT5U641_9GAMM|nr:bifunctional 3,4-dihydroxy-2-butanone-4-phosphate synthase/GTP cyclohydrolase II [Spartinivicinus sp. A2-2]MDE1461827.1 bifunctional 3,4-dihydroxy-2-butanone-4-phosphate synthase/GTP cyclohydrolase II [Spartinivicinus sp. A2-2]